MWEGRSYFRSFFEKIMESEIVYCFCNSKGEEDEFMIQCDGCGEWYHGKCLNPVVLDSEANFISEYYCTVCEPP